MKLTLQNKKLIYGLYKMWETKQAVADFTGYSLKDVELAVEWMEKRYDFDPKGKVSGFSTYKKD